MSTKSKHVEALFNTEVDQVFASTTIFLCFHLKKSLYRRSRSHQLDWSLRLTDESTTIYLELGIFQGDFWDLKLNSMFAFLTIIFLEFLLTPNAIDKYGQVIVSTVLLLSLLSLRPLSHLVLFRNSTNKLVEVLEWK